MDALQAIIAGVSPIVQLIILVLFGVIFYKPIAKSIFGYDTPDGQAALLEQMQTLTQHFNHDTTELLASIRDTLQKVAIGIDTMNKNQETLLRDHADSQELLRQFDKFGVKVRDCDVK